MDFNIEVRKKQLDHLDQLISSSKDKIHSVLNCLGWTAEGVKKDDPLVACPTNMHHRISTQVWSKHIEKCFLKQEGYNLSEQFLSDPPQDGPSSIYIDRNKKCEIIARELGETKDFRLAWNGLDPDPRTADRMLSTYSPHERLAFYNFSVHNSLGPPPPPEFTTIVRKEENEDKPLSYIEMLKKERDAKRRSAKYRSVHLNKKNHTEVMREVINGQMEEYRQWLSDNNRIKTYQSKPSKDCNNGNVNNVNSERGEEVERPHSSISRNSNHSGNSRRHESHRRERSPHHHERGYRRRHSPEERGYRSGHHDRDGRSSRDRSRYDRRH